MSVNQAPYRRARRCRAVSGLVAALMLLWALSSGSAEAVASGAVQIRPAGAPLGFGPSSVGFAVAGPDGQPDSQAGGHPAELTARIDLNSELRIGPDGNLVETSVQDVKDIVIDLPPGFLADAQAAPLCTFSQLSGIGCPADSAVGRIRTEPEGGDSLNTTIYDMVPEHGVPAEFGYIDPLKGSHALYAGVAPSAAGYVLRLIARELPQVTLTGLAVTLFGDPAAKDGSGNRPLPMLTNPSDCSGRPLVLGVHMDSWRNPGGYNADGTPDFGDPAWASATGQSPPVTGCSLLQFTPELGAQPTTGQADSPSGLELELRSPQTEDVLVNATPPLRSAVVALPEGMTVDPSAGDGLQACSEAQIGWGGPGPLDFTAAPPRCPEESKVGVLEMTTPLFAGTLTGAVYLAAQDQNPFGSVLAAYAVVEDPLTGVVLKIPGELRADPRTGRLALVLAESPQLPFSDLKLHFFGGPRALLATPQSCGTFTTTSELEPWSTLPGGTSSSDSGPDATPSDSFAIDSGCAGGFDPTFTGGSMNLQAGAYTPFIASFSRKDSDRELAGWSVSLPPGLLAAVGAVPLCPEAAADAGTCPEASRVGTVLAGAGAGPNPLFLPGKAFLTGPVPAGESNRPGGPFGLSLAVPVVAGPLSFGTVVVRASLRIDPNTAQVTVVSDPLPTILDVTGANGRVSGIPVRLRRVDVELNRPGFMFNPTSCDPTAVTATIADGGGASATVSSPFQVTNCTSLKFRPKATAWTEARAEALKGGVGASLNVKIASRGGPGTRGEEANIRRIDVALPKLLPARLQPTLQNACTKAQFAKDPAGCPPDSFVGTAVAVTPVFGAPLAGPAVFVSNGGAALPDLDLVLQGGGVEILLVGHTDVKGGVARAKFEAVPDAPISSFALTLPKGPHSALASGLPTNDKSLCGRRLRMGTTIEGQNGAVLRRNVKVRIKGCRRTHLRRGAWKPRAHRVVFPGHRRADATQKTRMRRRGSDPLKGRDLRE